jgi:hypothetical protein
VSAVDNNDGVVDGVLVLVLVALVAPYAVIRFFDGSAWVHILHAVVIVAGVLWVVFGWRVVAALDKVRADLALRQMED